jgi:multidrug resistance efflux pump
VRIAAADREVRRLKPLVGNNYTSRQSFDGANDEASLARAELADQEAAITAARAKLARAEVEVNRRTIRAPIDGTVVRRFVQLGDGISILNVTTLFWLAPSTPQIVRAEVDAVDAPRLAVGQVADITLVGNEVRHFRGRVKRLGDVLSPRRRSPFGLQDSKLRGPTAADGDSGSLECIITFDSPAPQLFLGQQVKVQIEAPLTNQ